MNKYIIGPYNRLELYFDGEPEVAVRDKLKKNHWMRRPKKCWENEYNSSNEEFAKNICLYCNLDIFGYHVVGYSKERISSEDWNLESKFRALGYTISSDEGLSDSDRRTILKNAITMNKATQSEIVFYLVGRIKLTENNKKFALIVSKYESDLKYVKKRRIYEFLC